MRSADVQAARSVRCGPGLPACRRHHITIRLEEHKPCEVVMVGDGRPTLHQDTDQGVRLLASPVVLMAICPTCPGSSAPDGYDAWGGDRALRTARRDQGT